MRALMLLLSAMLLAACSSFDVPDLRSEVERERIIPEGWQPLPMRVGLAPFRSALELDELRTNVENTRRWVLTPDEDRLNGSDGLHRTMLDVLREYRMFESIESIEGATPLNSRAEIQAMALRQGLDVVMIPTVRRHDVGYVDTNAAYGWNMFVWWMVSPLFSWWIADEDFDANLHIDLRLYAATQEGELAGRRIQPPQPVVRAFDDWDEGFNLFSIFTTPNHFSESNWRRVGDRLMPIADHEAKKAMLRYVTGELNQTAAQPHFRSAIRRRVALVIGVDGNGRTPIPLTRFAALDAQEFETQLTEAGHDAVQRAALRSLIGSRATRAAVAQAAEELAGLARANDDVILYFAGVGLIDDRGQLGIVLAQSTPGGRVDAMSLDELLAVLLKNKPRTLTLVLDCSFTAPASNRCATRASVLQALRDSGVRGNLLSELAKRVEEAGTACIVLSAADADLSADSGMPALEIDDLSHGLFTSFALLALSGDADQSGDGRVTAAEFRDYMQRHLTHISGLEGMHQAGWFVVPESRVTHRLPTSRRVEAVR